MNGLMSSIHAFGICDDWAICNTLFEYSITAIAFALGFID